MKKFILNYFLCVCIFSTFILSISISENTLAKPISYVEWQSPIPRFSELNLDANQIAEVAGEGLFILILNEKNINIWSKGKIKNFPDARITVAAAVIEAPLSVVRNKVLDIASMEAYMPQISSSSIINQHDKNNFMAEWIQTYKLPLLELKAKFLVQHRIEESGDISGLLHDGDIDSGVFRWEFIPISQNKTLVIYSYWGDQKSAGLAFKIIMKAQPELVLSMGAITATMILVQLQQVFINDEGTEAIINTELPKTPRIPVLDNNKDYIQTLVSLSEHGRLVLVKENQWVQDSNAAKPMRFVSGISVLPLPPEKVLPLATDYSAMVDYLPYFSKIDVEKNNNKKQVNSTLKINIGPIFIKTNNQLSTEWIKQGAVETFVSNETSDFYPFAGANEFYSLNNGESTLMVYSMSLDISDHAGWMLRMGRQLQEYALIMSVHQVVTLLDKQGEWIFKKNTH